MLVEECLCEILAQHILFLGHRYTESPFFKYWEFVFGLETSYTLAPIQGHRHPVSSDECQFCQSKRDSLLYDKVIQTLQLQSWQIREILLPGANLNILTDFQSAIFQQQSTPETTYVVNLYELKPQPAAPYTAYPSAIQDKHRSLYTSF